MTLEYMKVLARRHGGKCLSKRYVNSKTKLKWLCHKGHSWLAIPSNIVKGHWCSICGFSRSARQRALTIQRMREVARSRGGGCLSQNYVNAHVKLEWQCQKGHVWQAAPQHIIKGSWCSECLGRYKPSVYIREAELLANKRQGKCLSQTYIKSNRPLVWQCSENHTWESPLNAIRKGRWCPHCGKGVGERICRAYFESLFNAPFPKSRPKWLWTRQGTQLELDGYSKTLRIAFEHQGEHHYSKDAHYIRTSLSYNLAKRQQYDRLKRRLCREKGVALIVIPQLFSRLRLAALRHYIKRQCQRKNVSLPSGFDRKPIDLSPTFISDFRKWLAGLLRERGIQLDGTAFLGYSAKYRWKCRVGHRWVAVASKVKAGGGCPICLNRGGALTSQRRTILLSAVGKSAQKRGLRCLSRRYINARTKMKFRCQLGHIWKAVPYSIKAGTGCPACGRISTNKALKRLTLSDMQRLAKGRGGKCLSTVYCNNGTKLDWVCHEGHLWQATPGKIKGGRWCPRCAIERRALSRRGTIENMQRLARRRGGRCLSMKYEGNHLHLIWECRKGHCWKAVPSSIKQGTWCPKCARSRREKKKMWAPSGTRVMTPPFSTT